MAYSHNCESCYKRYQKYKYQKYLGPVCTCAANYETCISKTHHCICAENSTHCRVEFADMHKCICAENSTHCRTDRHDCECFYLRHERPDDLCPAKKHECICLFNLRCLSIDHDCSCLSYDKETKKMIINFKNCKNENGHKCICSRSVDDCRGTKHWRFSKTPVL
jgi:hypothetical protein